MNCTTATASRRVRSERGQTTAEYALVLLGVAAVALAFITWAGGGHIGQFLDTIFERLLATGK
jgi:Flp pilus assembly pilin Flp